MKLTCSR